jgi:hypothetical protein
VTILEDGGFAEYVKSSRLITGLANDDLDKAIDSERQQPADPFPVVHIYHDTVYHLHENAVRWMLAAAIRRLAQRDER